MEILAFSIVLFVFEFIPSLSAAIIILSPCFAG